MAFDSPSTASAAALWSRFSVANATESGGTVPSLLIQEAEQHWDVSGTAVLVAWIVTAFSSLIIFTLFSWRRQRAVRLQEPDVLIYLPRYWACKENEAERKKGIFTPPVPDIEPGFFAWLTPLWGDVSLEIQFWKTKAVLQRDYRMLELLGLDAVTYLQFLRLLRWLFACISVFVAGPLVYGNYYINTATQWGSTNSNLTSSSTTVGANTTTTSNNASLLDNMQLFTAANITGNGFYVHIAFEWIVTLLVSAFVWSHCTHHQDLVRYWTNMNVSEISFKTIMITGCNIEPKTRGQVMTVERAKEEVCSYFDPDVPGQRRGRGVDDGNDLVVHRQDALVTLTHQDMSRLSGKMETYVKKTKVNFERHLTGWLRRAESGPVTHYGSWRDCFMGRRKALVHHARDTGKERATIEQERVAVKAELKKRGDSDRLRQTVTSAFIAFRTARDAHQKLLAFKRRSGLPTAIKVQRSPRSENIIWANLEKTPMARRRHQIIGTIALVIICFLNTIPLLGITVLANLNILVEQVPYLNNLQKSSIVWKGLFATISGILPASIAAAFSYLLPYVMRYISRWSGAMSRGELDKNVIRQLFIFLLVSNFIVFSLLDVLYGTFVTVSTEIGKQSLGEIYGSLGDLPAKVTRAYISESSYWLSWYPIRATLVCLELLQVPRWLLTFYQAFFAVKTGSDIKEMGQPKRFEVSFISITSPDGADHDDSMLFAMVVALVYTPLAPIVVICGTLYFWAASFIYYIQLKYVEDTKETDGKVWRVIINRLLTACVIMQLLMMTTVALKTKSAQMCLLSAIPILFIIILRHSIEKKITSSSDLVGLDPSSKAGSHARRGGGTLQPFEHWLLRDKWEPNWGFIPSDWKEFQHLMGGKIELLKSVEPMPQAEAQTAEAESKAKGKEEGGEIPRVQAAEEKQLAAELIPVFGGKDEVKPKKRRGWGKRRKR